MVAIETIEVRSVRAADADELAALVNAIIAQGGTTALEEAFTPERLAQAYLTGPAVHCCFVAIDADTGRIEGFQTLGCDHDLPGDVGDIGTFTRLGGTKRGVGSALFAATKRRAIDLGLSAINATIRADNDGGLAFYGKKGFVDHAVVKNVPLRDGTQIDRVQKRYSLDQSEI